MTAINQSPSGFSYAQAAKGQSVTISKAPSSKVTSGTATPANGTFADLGPASNWADDVEATVGDKSDRASESRKTLPEQSKEQVKDGAVDLTKSESKPPNGSSGVSTQDLAALSVTTPNTDESSLAQNGVTPSESTEETKSQGSEPAWVVERTERQNRGNNEEGKGSKRGKKEPKEAKEAKEAAAHPPVPQPKLTEAPPPAVNPWAKRMEAVKTKSAVTAPPPQPVAAIPALTNIKENQRPGPESRRKANSVTSIARDAAPVATNAHESKKSNGPQEHTRADSGATATPRAAQREHQSLPNLAVVPPPVKDDVSWPTPENAQEKERKETHTDKDQDEAADAEAASSSKREKTKWKPVPVTPTIVWETEEMNRPPRGQNGERGGRGGERGRGRGGYRGTANGSKGGDRAAARNGNSHSEGEHSSSHRGRSSTIEGEGVQTSAKTDVGESSGRQSQEHSRAPASGNNALANGKLTTGEVITSDAAAHFSDARRSNSPSKTDLEGPNGQHEAHISEPIPRQNHATQTVDQTSNGETAREGPTIRRVPSDGKRDSRSFEPFGGKEWNGTSRGAKRERGGRGRGSNGHQAAQAYANGHGDYTGYAQVPQSPSAYQPARGFGYSQQSRGGWSRGNPRSQSIPIEHVYGNRQFWSGMPPVQQPGFYPGHWDPYTSMPYSAMPGFYAAPEHQNSMDAVQQQLEYYFSMDNLLKDMFLRKHMDGQGFVFLDVIADFKRLKTLTSDLDMIRAACMRSDTIEIRVGEDGKERLRAREGFENFILPQDQRVQNAQNGGPEVLQRLEQPQIHYWSPPAAYRGLPGAGLSGRRSYDAGFAMNGAIPGFSPFSPMAEASYNDMANGEESRGRATKSPLRDNSVPPGQQPFSGAMDKDDAEPDVFGDHLIGELTVVVKPIAQRSSMSHNHAAARTFSNGSIDTRSIFNEMEKATEASAQPAVNGEAVVNGEHNGASVSRHTSPGQDRSPEKGKKGSEVTLLWLKNKETPQPATPSDGTTEPYISLRDKAIQQRHDAATGNCPYDLDVLYQFWSHFLIRNFNKSMYREFRHLAHLDARERHNGVGLDNLVLFYSNALASSNPIRDVVVRDYVALVKDEPSILGGTAYGKLRQAWRDGALNLKNRKKLSDVIDDTLKAKLES